MPRCCAACGSTTRRAPSRNAPRSSRSTSACGRPAGWARARSRSNVTPDLLKEAGYTHLLDWPVDDQPIWMRTRAGPLLSVPYPMELNDAGTLVHRDHTGREFADMIVDQFEELLEQSSASRWSSRWRCTASSSASRSGCGRCGRRSSIASSTSTGTGSGSRGRARSRVAISPAGGSGGGRAPARAAPPPARAPAPSCARRRRASRAQSLPPRACRRRDDQAREPAERRIAGLARARDLAA